MLTLCCARGQDGGNDKFPIIEGIWVPYRMVSNWSCRTWTSCGDFIMFLTTSRGVAIITERRGLTCDRRDSSRFAHTTIYLASLLWEQFYETRGWLHFDMLSSKLNKAFERYAPCRNWGSGFCLIGYEVLQFGIRSLYCPHVNRPPTVFSHDGLVAAGFPRCLQSNILPLFPFHHMASHLHWFQYRDVQD